MENWLFFAVTGYLLLAVEAVIAKALLTKKVKSWQLFSFYVGLLSLSGVFFAPFGLKWFGGFLFFESLIAGVIFYLALIFLYKSLEKSSASRVFVLYGAITTLASFILGHFLLKEDFLIIELLGIALLVMGGFFISFKFYKKRLFSSYKNVIFAGILMALALIVMKDVYDRQNFITGYVFSRIGVFLSALGLLLSSRFREVIKQSFSQKQKKISQRNFGLVVGAKTIAGIGTFLVNYSISLGSVVLINALVSIQYLFTFVLATLAAIFFKNFVREKITWMNLFLKLVGVGSIIAGIFLINSN
ncbi:MAG: hypothetical protein KAQ63_03045 [Candidatus Moranbacteria bacterium]|nr:hypothetical protein [Candidatus Moranbacteria bacterium]